jgi:hypothetical protein
MLLAIVLATAVTAVEGQAPPPRVFLVVVDDLHLDSETTPRLWKLLEEIPQRGREEDIWALVTTGPSSVRVEPGPGLGAIRDAIPRISGSGLRARQELDAFGDAERAAIIRRRALLLDISIANTISHLAEDQPGPLTILFITNGYDARMVPAFAEVIQATADTRARFVAVSVRDVIVTEPPADVSGDEWAGYVEGSRQSLRVLAEQTGGRAVFSQTEFEAIVMAP